MLKHIEITKGYIAKLMRESECWLWIIEYLLCAPNFEQYKYIINIHIVKTVLNTISNVDLSE